MRKKTRCFDVVEAGGAFHNSGCLLQNHFSSSCLRHIHFRVFFFFFLHQVLNVRTYKLYRYTRINIFCIIIYLYIFFRDEIFHPRVYRESFILQFFSLFKYIFSSDDWEFHLDNNILDILDYLFMIKI